MGHLEKMLLSLVLVCGTDDSGWTWSWNVSCVPWTNNQIVKYLLGS